MWVVVCSKLRSPPSTELTVSVVFMKLLSVASSLLLNHSFRFARHSDQLTSIAGFEQFHGTVSTLACPGQLIVRLLLDGSCYTRRWCWFASPQLHSVEHYPQVFCVGHDLSPTMCRCQDLEQDSLCKRINLLRVIRSYTRSWCVSRDTKSSLLPSLAVDSRLATILRVVSERSQLFADCPNCSFCEAVARCAVSR